MKDEQHIRDANGVQRGFRCSCGKEYMFNSWVYAHWNDEVHMNCECGKRYYIISGDVGEHLV